MEIKETQDRLLKELAGLDRLLISYSRGVDSTLLAVFAQEQLTMPQKLHINSVYLAT
jgi:pyridinium-3,5-biscarboxylic acid mononucleotide sulfurtransferase